VVVATPDHWHAPAAILACEAGKHVYVEKPQSHNLRESRLLLDAARRNQVVVQHGTQSRSSPLIAGAVQMLREGVIGDVLVAKAWNIQRRGSIGHEQPSEPPAGVDYDAWVGPAEFVPFQKNRFHYHWHWWYNFGTGDIGNDGTHEIDYARWGLGVEGLPATATGLGGKYFFDDDQEFPDTATCTFEWPGDGRVGSRRQLIFEMRLWSTNYPFNCDSGAEFYGTAGRMLVSKRGKVEVYGERDRRIDNAGPKEPPQLVGSHQADFLDAIRTNRKPNADVAEGHDSVALVHLANVAVRLGRSLKLEAGKETIAGDEEANALLSRNYREGGHWAIPKGVQS
jgi:predicted dehydrogenase